MKPAGTPHPSGFEYDAIVVGGGAAGLSAALMLGRARRRTLVIDAGCPRNLPSPASHGVFTRDGTPPSELLRIARAQLAPYRSVVVRSLVAAVAARRGMHGFELELSDRSVVRGRRVLLAVGVRDRLPDIPGAAELWGTRVLHCPHCHGFEVSDAPLAVYGGGQPALELARLVLGWSRDVVLCTGGRGELSAEQRDLLHRNGVRVIERAVERVAAAPDGDGVRLELAGGLVEHRRALFLRPDTVVACPVADQLGCERTETGHIRVGADHSTSVAGVYAAGDSSARGGQVVVAAASGAQAAASLNGDLAKEDFEVRGPESLPEDARQAEAVA
ncbi:MAG TPA: NAD(P)/FAD-dependent oxidoreductase [Gemmatimonadales bacterium]|nr:NAD(P)/FAD-dependent oxidoreductase [Gemmatimonadales bacterium]